jgi:hypothetical protein
MGYYYRDEEEVPKTIRIIHYLPIDKLIWLVTKKVERDDRRMGRGRNRGT